MQNCFIYCRKSTDSADKQEQSLETQERICLETAKRFGFNVVDVIFESRSAKDAGNRPEFDGLISRFKAGEADILVTWDIDRLARNLTEAGLLQSLYENGFIKQIITQHDIYKSDRDFMNIGHEFVDASNFSRKLSNKVKDGNQTAVEKGKIPGAVKTGYYSIDGVMKPDPDRAPFVTYAFELYVEGYSVRDIAKQLYELGFRSKKGNKIYPASIHKMLRRIDYTGVFSYAGNLYQGSYEPLISMELFEKVQKLLTKNNIPKSNKHWFLYRGFITCAECGCMHTASIKKGKYIYYYCTNSKMICKQKSNYIEEQKMHKLYQNQLSKLPLDIEIMDKSYSLYAKNYLERYKDIDNQKKLLKKQITSVETRKKRLVDLYIDGNIQQEVYNLKYKELTLERETLTNSLEQLQTTKPEQTLELIKKFKDYCSGLQNMYSDGDNEVKSEILKSVCWNFSMLEGEIASIQYKKPFDLIAKLPKNDQIRNWWTVGDSNS